MSDAPATLGTPAVSFGSPVSPASAVAVIVPVPDALKEPLVPITSAPAFVPGVTDANDGEPPPPPLARHSKRLFAATQVMTYASLHVSGNLIRSPCRLVALPVCTFCAEPSPARKTTKAKSFLIRPPTT